MHSMFCVRACVRLLSIADWLFGKWDSRLLSPSRRQLPHSVQVSIPEQDSGAEGPGTSALIGTNSLVPRSSALCVGGWKFMYKTTCRVPVPTSSRQGAAPRLAQGGSVLAMPPGCGGEDAPSQKTSLTWQFNQKGGAKQGKAISVCENLLMFPYTPVQLLLILTEHRIPATVMEPAVHCACCCTPTLEGGRGHRLGQSSQRLGFPGGN